MTKKLKRILTVFFTVLLAKFAEDLFILAGISVIIATTYMKFGMTVGNYALGLVLLVFGFLIAKK